MLRALPQALFRPDPHAPQRTCNGVCPSALAACGDALEIKLRRGPLLVFGAPAAPMSGKESSLCISPSLALARCQRLSEELPKTSLSSTFPRFASERRRPSRLANSRFRRRRRRIKVCTMPLRATRWKIEVLAGSDSSNCSVSRPAGWAPASSSVLANVKSP